MTMKSIDEPCFSSKECESSSGARCIGSFGEIDGPTPATAAAIHKEGTSVTSGSSSDSLAPAAMAGLLAPNVFYSLNAGYCRCPPGFFHHQEKGKCVKRVIGVECQNSSDCFARQHSLCDAGTGRCSCDSGFELDSQADQCRPAFVTTSPSGGESRHSGSPRATPLCEYGLIWDQGVRKCVPLIHWETNRTWSALVWKVAVLCIVLVLLMMLASGVQRARQTDNLLNWSRALELYAARGGSSGANGSTLDLEAAVRTAAAAAAAGNSSTRSNGASPSSLLDASGLISRDGVVLVLPAGMPPPPPSYTAVDMTTPAVTELPVDVATVTACDQPPSYEEAIRSSLHRQQHQRTPSDHLISRNHHAITSSTSPALNHGTSCPADIIEAASK